MDAYDYGSLDRLDYIDAGEDAPQDHPSMVDAPIPGRERRKAEHERKEAEAAEKAEKEAAEKGQHKEFKSKQREVTIPGEALCIDLHSK